MSLLFEVGRFSKDTPDLPLWVDNFTESSLHELYFTHFDLVCFKFLFTFLAQCLSSNIFMCVVIDSIYFMELL